MGGVETQKLGSQQRRPPPDVRGKVAAAKKKNGKTKLGRRNAK
jgi:hypothetical protein